VFRNPNGTFKGQTDIVHGGSNVPLVGNTPGSGFIQGPFNFARLVTSGIDFDLAYRTRISDDVRLNLRGVLNYTFKKNLHSDVNAPDFIDRILGETGDPVWAANVSANLEYKIFNFGYRLRVIGKTTSFGAAWETQHPLQGRPPTDPDAFPVVMYPEVFYHDVRIDINATKRFKFYMGVDNVFDRLPPFELLGNEAGVPFNPTGRFFYGGVEVKF
jgi:outer membrane receptor protein involved in Fe transport